MLIKSIIKNHFFFVSFVAAFFFLKDHGREISVRGGEIKKKRKDIYESLGDVTIVFFFIILFQYLFCF